MDIYWNEPKFEEFEGELVSHVLKSGYVSEGPVTRELEERLAEIVGCKHVIMTTSCTAALFLSVLALTPHQDNYEYIIPSLAFLATKNAVVCTGNVYKELDVDKDRFLLDYRTILEDNTININIEMESIQKKGLIIINLLGRGVSEDVIKELKNKGKSIICDNAGCLGSKVPIGDIGCYSLQGNKIISCGQGGFCATNNDELAKEIRKLKDFGRRNKEDNMSVGLNFKFNDILSAVALGQLKGLKDRMDLLKFQYNHYKFELNKLGRFIEFQEGEIPLWVEFITSERDKLFDFLNKAGIHCRKPWGPVSNFSSLEGNPFVNSTYYNKNCIWLPNGPTLSTYNLNVVIKKIKEFFELQSN